MIPNWKFAPRAATNGKGSMKRVNAHYLYDTGAKIHPVLEIAGPNSQNPTDRGQAWLSLYVAEGSLETLLQQDLLQLKTCIQAGQDFLNIIKLSRKYLEENNEQSLNEMHVFKIKEEGKKFEAVLQAELSIADFYVVSKKGAYDTTDLILYGEKAFLSDLLSKVPSAFLDVREATKCIAFELWTAAGFHLHRANEAVLGVYWDVVTSGKQRPKDRNMGTYLRELEKPDPKLGSGKVRSALRDIKDMHRNPLIHPEQSLNDCDDALSLLSAIHNVVAEMLKEIPTPAPSAFVNALSAGLGRGPLENP